MYTFPFSVRAISYVWCSLLIHACRSNDETKWNYTHNQHFGDFMLKRRRKTKKNRRTISKSVRLPKRKHCRDQESWFNLAVIFENVIAFNHAIKHFHQLKMLCMTVWACVWVCFSLAILFFRVFKLQHTPSIITTTPIIVKSIGFNRAKMEIDCARTRFLRDRNCKFT